MYSLAVVFAVLVYGNAVPLPPPPVGLLDSRIVGGRNATIEEFPYQLSFELDGEHWCGASLIRPDVALTAAHCTEHVHSYLQYLTVRSGTAIREEGGQVAKVVSICEHSQYNFPDYDVSVLQLDRSLSLDKSTQIIELQLTEEKLPPGTVGIVTGWGHLFFEGEAPLVLQALSVPKIEDATCAEFYPDEDITSRMFCFGYEEGGKDACQGDSGGPLVANGRQIGVVSWGYGCAFPKLPGVYAKLSDPGISGHVSNCVAGFYSNKGVNK